MSLDRTIGPSLIIPTQLQIQEPQQSNLSNGTPVSLFQQDDVDVLRFTLIFKAGKWFESRKLVARAAGRLMKEGTNSRNSIEISEFIDYHGASFHASGTADDMEVNVSCLRKDLEKVLLLTNEILLEANYPKQEVDLWRRRRKQDLLISLEKNEVIASNEFWKKLYGEKHPYGQAAEAADYDELQREALIGYHKSVFCEMPFELIIAGKCTDNDLKLFDQHLGQKDRQGSLIAEDHQVHESGEKKSRISLDGSVQSAIRIGNRTIGRNHKDFFDLTIANTILGGYFGSRLMSNIREVKGYTYGIYSMMNPYVNEGNWLVSTEVGIDVTEDAVKEIYFEIDRLRNDLVPSDELELVKNYLSGSLLSSLDGPFKLIKSYRGVRRFDQDMSYYHQLFETIRSADSKRIMDVSQQYLVPENMYEMVVG